MRKLKWEYSVREHCSKYISQTKIWIIHILLSISLSTFFSPSVQLLLVFIVSTCLLMIFYVVWLSVWQLFFLSASCVNVVCSCYLNFMIFNISPRIIPFCSSEWVHLYVSSIISNYTFALCLLTIFFPFAKPFIIAFLCGVSTLLFSSSLQWPAFEFFFVQIHNFVCHEKMISNNNSI